MSSAHPQAAKNAPMMLQPVPQAQMIQYQPNMQYAMPPPVIHLQPQFVPNDYFIPTLIIAIAGPICSFSTIFFTVAALVCSILSGVHKSKGAEHYLQAKRFGQTALILDIIALLWLFGWGFFVLIYSGYLIYVDKILH